MDTPPAAVIEFPQSPITAPETEQKTMTLTYKNLSKNGKNAFYAGAAVALRIPLTAFVDKVAPQTIEVAGGVFAPAKQPKAKLTKEERAAQAAQKKAERANQPKPTLAEKIARREAQLAKDKAKLEASQQASL